MSRLLRRARPPGPDGCTVGVSPPDAGWQYVHFHAYTLTAGSVFAGETGGLEVALIVLGGQADAATSRGDWAAVGGRPDVWTRTPAATILMGPGERYRLTCRTPLHFAVAAAPAAGWRGGRLIGPEEVIREERGEGNTKRYIHHLLHESREAGRLLLVEVWTPAGNWSSYPPHKHDTHDLPRESYLEETYYYQVKPEQGYALQRVYGEGLDEVAVPKNGDLVLVPRGYHPVGAPPGYDCYYLNVMAGPVRAWRFTVDPDHRWLMNWAPPRA